MGAFSYLIFSVFLRQPGRTGRITAALAGCWFRSGTTWLTRGTAKMSRWYDPIFA